MPVTRRSILRTAAALSAALAIPGLSTGLAFASGPFAPHPDSILVALEGPWLIDQPVKGSVRATSLGQLSKAADMHFCEVGLIDTQSTTKAIVNPLSLAGGENWTVRATGAVPTTSFRAAFDAAFARTPFVYIRDREAKATPRPGDRIVTLPMPDRVYFGQPMSNTVVNDTSRMLAYPTLSSARPHPYETVLLEYRSRRNLSLEPVNADRITLASGQHLTFRMEYKPMQGPEAVHIQAAFSGLAARVAVGPAPLELSLTLPRPARMPATYQPGHVHFQQVNETPDDCRVGGIILA